MAKPVKGTRIPIVTAAAPSSVTVDTALTITDANSVINCTNSADITITIQKNTDAAFTIGTEIVILRSGTGNVTIAPAAGVTLNSDGGKRKIKTQHGSVAIKNIGTDTWLLVGALTA